MKFYKIEDIWFMYNTKTKEIMMADSNNNIVMKICPVEKILKKLSVENSKDWYWRHSYSIKKSKLKEWLENYK